LSPSFFLCEDGEGTPVIFGASDPPERDPSGRFMVFHLWALPGVWVQTVRLGAAFQQLPQSSSFLSVSLDCSWIFLWQRVFPLFPGLLHGCFCQRSFYSLGAFRISGGGPVFEPFPPPLVSLQADRPVLRTNLPSHLAPLVVCTTQLFSALDAFSRGCASSKSFGDWDAESRSLGLRSRRASRFSAGQSPVVEGPVLWCW